MSLENVRLPQMYDSREYPDGSVRVVMQLCIPPGFIQPIIDDDGLMTFVVPAGPSSEALMLHNEYEAKMRAAMLEYYNELEKRFGVRVLGGGEVLYSQKARIMLDGLDGNDPKPFEGESAESFRVRVEGYIQRQEAIKREGQDEAETESANV